MHIHQFKYDLFIANNEMTNTKDEVVEEINSLRTYHEQMNTYKQQYLFPQQNDNQQISHHSDQQPESSVNHDSNNHFNAGITYNISNSNLALSMLPSVTLYLCIYSFIFV